MFCSCKSLTQLDLSNFDTSKVTNVIYMFYGCGNLVTIYVSNEWSINLVEYSNDMFGDCFSLPNYDRFKIDKTNAHCGEDGYLTLKR